MTWLSITLALAIALTTLLPFFAVHNLPADDAGHHLSAVFGEKILICTGDGFAWVKLADLEGGKEKLPPSSGKCPLCYAATHGLKTTAAVLAVSTQDYHLPPPASVSYRCPPISLYQALPFNGRAPPIPFIG